MGARSALAVDVRVVHLQAVVAEPFPQNPEVEIHDVPTGENVRIKKPNLIAKRRQKGRLVGHTGDVWMAQAGANVQHRARTPPPEGVHQEHCFFM